MQILIKIAFIFLPMLSFGQIAFYKHYSDYNYDFGQGIVQLEDSSYVVTGTSGSFAGHAQRLKLNGGYGHSQASAIGGHGQGLRLNGGCGQIQT